jgi:hypothetical protein
MSPPADLDRLSHDGFLDEARDVLRAGLSSAKWITVDDTGARHKAVNGFCTQIGNCISRGLAPPRQFSRSPACRP